MKKGKIIILNKSEKGSALLLAIVFVAVFLILLSVLIGMYLFELKMFVRYQNIYRAELVTRDTMAIVSAEEHKWLVDKNTGFVENMAESNTEFISSTSDFLRLYPFPSSYGSYYPDGVVYISAEKNLSGAPNVVTAAIMSGHGLSTADILAKVQSDAWPFVNEFEYRKIFAKYQVAGKDLNKLGNTANVTLDYGPYARLDGDVVFKTGSSGDTFNFWGVRSNVNGWDSSHSDDWRVYRPDRSGYISSSNYRRMLDTAILGKLYFGGSDFTVGDPNYRTTYYSFTRRFSDTVSSSWAFSGLSVMDFREESKAKQFASLFGYYYYYDPGKNLWHVITRHTADKSDWQTTNDVFFKNILINGAEVDSQYAEDITEYLFGTIDGKGAWERLVSGTDDTTAKERAVSDNNYLEVNETNISSWKVAGSRAWYESYNNSLLVTFYVDNDEHTHMLLSIGYYFDNSGYVVGEYDYRRRFKTDVNIYDVDLTQVSHDGKKILVDFSNYDYVHIIPPCAIRGDGYPVWKDVNIAGNPMCEYVSSKYGYMVNQYINPQARDTSLNPNWNYDWTHYVYITTPQGFYNVWPESSYSLAQPYHANWQNVNMYSMKITIVANNVYLVSNLVPMPKDGLLFEQDFSTNPKDLVIGVDLPGLSGYPDGEVMAMYVKNDFLIKAYSCGDNYYDNRKNILACRGAAMYGFRFPADDTRFLSPDVFNFGDRSKTNSKFAKHAWDTLFYSHMLAIKGSWGLQKVDWYYPYTMENFKKMGALGQGSGGYGMISSGSSEGHQGYFGNRYYLIADNPYSNPPAYWLIPPEEWRSVTIVNYRMGR